MLDFDSGFRSTRKLLRERYVVTEETHVCTYCKHEFPRAHFVQKTGWKTERIAKLCRKCRRKAQQGQATESWVDFTMRQLRGKDY
jgi:hypothetical protein